MELKCNEYDSALCSDIYSECMRGLEASDRFIMNPFEKLFIYVPFIKITPFVPIRLHYVSLRANGFKSTLYINRSW